MAHASGPSSLTRAAAADPKITDTAKTPLEKSHDAVPLLKTAAQSVGVSVATPRSHRWCRQGRWPSSRAGRCGGSGPYLRPSSGSSTRPPRRSSDGATRLHRHTQRLKTRETTASTVCCSVAGRQHIILPPAQSMMSDILEEDWPSSASCSQARHARIHTKMPQADTDTGETGVYRFTVDWNAHCELMQYDITEAYRQCH